MAHLIEVAMDDVAQRWRKGRAGFRVFGERINPLEYSVVHTKDHAQARAFVLREHYSKSWPSACEVFELRWHAQLVGVAVFGEPGGPAVLTKWFPTNEALSVGLGRFVLLDLVPWNAETWFLARCFELLRKEHYFGVLSFSDPMPRDRDDGTIVFPGHIGGIYLAFNGMFLGKSEEETVWIFQDDGTAFAPRMRTKIRAYARGDLEKANGWKSGVDKLLDHGASPFPFTPGDERAALWCDEQIVRLTRAYRHPGNYRFAWGLNDTAKRVIRARARALKLDNLKHPRVLIPGKPRLHRLAA